MTFGKLSQEYDLDAMTACLGLIQEAVFLGQSNQYSYYTFPSFNVYRRLILKPPFLQIAYELYCYMQSHFWNNPDGETIKKHIGRDDLELLLTNAWSRLLLIEDMVLLKTYNFTPYSCLYIAEKYLTPQVISEIDDLTGTENERNIKLIPAVKNLSHALQRWEKKNPGNLR